MAQLREELAATGQDKAQADIEAQYALSFLLPRVLYER
jgi:hypothetical protein